MNYYTKWLSIELNKKNKELDLIDGQLEKISSETNKKALDKKFALRKEKRKINRQIKEIRVNLNGFDFEDNF